MSPHGSDHIPTNPDPAAFAHWPEGLYEEMLRSHDNGCVGSVLVSETNRVRGVAFAPGRGCALRISSPCEPPTFGRC
jgi:hypothetical protein